jgi:hypothetical protein
VNRTADVALVFAAEVGAVGQVERLEHEFQGALFSELEGFAEPRVQLEERQAALGTERRSVARPGRQAASDLCGGVRLGRLQVGRLIVQQHCKVGGAAVADTVIIQALLQRVGTGRTPR